MLNITALTTSFAKEYSSGPSSISVHPIALFVLELQLAKKKKKKKTKPGVSKRGYFLDMQDMFTCP